MNIENSKNVVNDRVDAQGNVIIGDGNNITIINLKEAAQYKHLLFQLEEKNKRFYKVKQKIAQYPNDQDFEDELLYISKEIDEIKTQQDSLIREILKLADEFSKIPINTERLRLAKQYFENGEFDKAKAILDSEKMSTELDDAIKQEELGENLIQKAKETRQQLSNEFLISAHLASFDFTDYSRFEKAKEYYEKSLKASRNALNVFSFAYFLQNHNQFSEVLPLYIEAIELYKKILISNPGFSKSNSFLHDFATAYNNLGETYRMFNKYDDSELNFIEALNIYKKISSKEPEIYLVYFAHVLNNLGLVQKAKYKFDLAEDNYIEALRLYKNLSKNDSIQYLPYVGAVLNNLGLLYIEKKEFEFAEKSYIDSIEVKRKLNPEIYSRDLALTLNNLGVLYLHKNKLNIAKDTYNEALSINRDLVEKNPYGNLAELANTLSNLANLRKKMKDYQLAENDYKEALIIFEKLAKSSPLNYNPNVAAALTNLAVFYAETLRFDLAEKLFIKALNIRKQLALDNPQVFLPAIAISTGNMSLFYKQGLINREKSLSFASEALKSGMPFEKYLIDVQGIIRIVKQVIEGWGMNYDEFLKEAITSK